MGYESMTAADRQEERERIAADALAEARRKAVRLGRSIKCGESQEHAPAGCRSDGSSCICFCHDPAGSSRKETRPADRWWTHGGSCGPTHGNADGPHWPSCVGCGRPASELTWEVRP